MDSRGQVPPKRDAAHGKPNISSIRPWRGRISAPSHPPQRIDDPLRVGGSVAASSGGDAALAPGYYRAGLQPATPPAESVTDPVPGEPRVFLHRGWRRIIGVDRSNLST